MARTMMEREILHYPQLDTVLMVEEFIKQHSGEFKKRQLWENLPRKMMYQTFCVIFDYVIKRFARNHSCVIHIGKCCATLMTTLLTLFWR